MTTYLKSIIIATTFLLTPTANAKQSPYEFIDALNQSLTQHINQSETPFHGVEKLSTFQKNSQIIVQVTHHPTLSYSALIKKLAEQGSRVNGVNFQNSFTLSVLSGYCQKGLFYTIRARGIDKDVLVKYEDLKGKFITIHSINRKMCHQ